MSLGDQMTVTEPTSTPGREVPAVSQRRGSLLHYQAFPVACALLGLVVLTALFVPNVFKSASIVAIVVPASVLAVAAIGQTLVMQVRGIDLSVGGMMTLAAVTVGVMHQDGHSSLTGLVVVAVLAVAGGLVNGLLVTQLSVTPLLATLAANSLFIGVVFTVTGGSSQGSPGYLRDFAGAKWLSVPVMGWAAVLLVVVVAAVMSGTVVGRRFTGVGANPAAARAMGVSTTRHVVAAYVACALFAAVAGLMLAGYAGDSTYDIGVSYQLPVIAAVVVGGASLAGGRGSVIATGLAALLLTLVLQAVLTMGAPTSIRLLAQSIVLGLAAALRMVPWRSLLRRG
jgi:ribose transport system permease protein